MMISSSRGNSRNHELTITEKIELLGNKGKSIGNILTTSNIATLLLLAILLTTTFMFASLPTDKEGANIIVQGNIERIESSHITWNTVLDHLKGLEEGLSLTGVISLLPTYDEVDEFESNKSRGITSPFGHVFEEVVNNKLTNIMAALMLLAGLFQGIVKQNYVTLIGFVICSAFLSYAGEIVNSFFAIPESKAEVSKYEPMAVELIFLASQEVYNNKNKAMEELPLIWDLLQREQLIIDASISSKTNEQLYLMDKFLHESVTLPINKALENKVNKENDSIVEMQKFVGLALFIACVFSMIMFWLNRNIVNRVKRIKEMLSIEDDIETVANRNVEIETKEVQLNK